MLMQHVLDQMQKGQLVDWRQVAQMQPIMFAAVAEQFAEESVNRERAVDDITLKAMADAVGMQFPEVP